MHAIGFKGPKEKVISTQLTSKNHIKLFKHTIDFTPTGIILTSPQQLEMRGEASQIHSDNLNITSQHSIHIHIRGQLVIKSQHVVLSAANQCLTLSASGCKIEGQKITLKSADSLASSPVCQGDQHHCPASTGSKPHIGGILPQGSSSVFINKKGVCRHGDISPCHGTPNQIVSHTRCIQVDNRPIAHTQATTLHQGQLNAQQHTVSLSNQQLLTNNQTAHKANQHSLLMHIKTIGQDNSVDNEQKSIHLSFEKEKRQWTGKQQPIVMSGLTLEDLNSSIQISID